MASAAFLKRAKPEFRFYCWIAHMPRLKHTVPKLCKRKKSGRAYVTIDGYEHYLGAAFGTPEAQAEYDRLIGEYLTSGCDAAAVNPGQRVNIERVIKAFWIFAKDYYVKNGTPTSEWHAYRQVCRTMRRLYGRTIAEEFGPLALKTLRHSWMDQSLWRLCSARRTIQSSNNGALPFLGPRHFITQNDYFGAQITKFYSRLACQSLTQHNFVHKSTNQTLLLRMGHSTIEPN